MKGKGRLYCQPVFILLCPGGLLTPSVSSVSWYEQRILRDYAKEGRCRLYKMPPNASDSHISLFALDVRGHQSAFFWTPAYGEILPGTSCLSNILQKEPALWVTFYRRNQLFG